MKINLHKSSPETPQLLIENESCAVAHPMQRNTATFDQKNATSSATTPQLTTLKALAGKVLRRNSDRNHNAPGEHIHRNSTTFNTPKKESCAVALYRDRNTATFEKTAPIMGAKNTIPTHCMSCGRLDTLTISGEEIPGCLYIAQGRYFDGWRRIPADIETCIWNSEGNQ
jgi:hypothetical protein